MARLEELLEEIVVSQDRIAKALEHTHKCDEEISRTLKEQLKVDKAMLKIHKNWSTVGVKHSKP